MPNTVISWQVNGKSIKAEFIMPVTMDEPQWQKFVDSLQFFSTQLSLKKLTFQHDSGTEYDYTFTTQDGRKWKQSLYFDTPANPGMTFTVSDKFMLNEFIPQRDVRDALIELVKDFKLQSLIVNWR